MGDRGNIVIESQDKTSKLFFYTHYYGSQLHRLVAQALARGKSRWDDEPYLNRILFSALVAGDVNGTTGAGISTTMGDGGCEVYICHEEERVRFRGKKYTFSEFVDAFQNQNGKPDDEDEDEGDD